MMRIAIATEQEYLEKGWKEDNVLRIKLVSLLRNEGISFPESNVVIIDWRDRLINPHTFNAIFISSTWNAVDFPNEFLEWLNNCESDGTARIINCSEIIAKAFDKKNYFQELASVLDKQNIRGKLIPTYFTSPAYQGVSLTEIRSFFKKSDFEAKELVLKPRISADGKDLSRIKLDGRSDDAIEAEIIQALKKTKVKSSGGMIQPLIDTIETGSDHGEYQLLFLNGKFSHANVKPPGFEKLPDGMNEFSEFIADYFFKKYNSGHVS
ncbi:Cycloserine biosynthesis [Brachionus plicatilis]|uniref:Cycloserine biosynthesis n=1 Tax=Brachionus plicatilis TaxID=10195 RepID=A0A3M7P4H1_BRAPC|nr:Cycloserine biosynthesis [Brachionus plicatilis]